jgi:hypothetical protein
LADWKAFKDSLESLIQIVQHDLDRLERGDVRSYERTQNGWQDRTPQDIHEKRNLIATLKATLGVIDALTRPEPRRQQ